MRSRRLDRFRSALLLCCLFAVLGLPDKAEAVPAGGPCLISLNCDGDLVCAFPQQVCRHDPPIVGEPCSEAFVPCAPGLGLICPAFLLRCVHSPAREGERCNLTFGCENDLFCQPNIVPTEAGTCVARRGVGQGCNPLIPPLKCLQELDCVPCFDGEECNAPFQCFPEGVNSPIPTPVCRAIYSKAVHDLVTPLGVTVTHGRGGGTVVGVGTSFEVGVAYGSDGRYGCYLTTCAGREISIGIETSACNGLYFDYQDVRGESASVVTGLSIPVPPASVGLSQAVIFAPPGPLQGGEIIGGSRCASIGVGIGAPINAGTYDCTTVLNTVIGNEPPEAVCRDQTVCADEFACTADVDVDGGSSDPDGDSFTLVQSAESPYPIGSHVVTLTATDPSGDSASCTAAVLVDDCTPPSVICPNPTTVECEMAEQTLVDPGDASVTDCSSFEVTDPGPASYPVGTTDVEYVATDSAGNSASCSTQVSVEDTTAPTITAVTPTPSALAPPNHEMRTVEIVIEASDACDPTLTCGVVDIASNEPEGRKTPDAVILDPDTVSLRAEREGGGSGRVYTITVECLDDTGGNATQAVTTVTVEHDKRAARRPRCGLGWEVATLLVPLGWMVARRRRRVL